MISRLDSQLRVAIVTYRNPKTGSRSFHDYGEDEELVAQGLSSRGFEVIVTSMEELRDVTRDMFDVIYVSNISPEEGEEDAHFFLERKKFYTRAETLHLPIHNGHEANRDRLGKGYLVDIFKMEGEVIPTIDSILDFEKLPVISQYISKPKLGFYSRGCLLIERNDILPLHFEDRVVQPFYSNVIQEISIYVIDGNIEYATSCPSKLLAAGWDKLVEHIPTEEECRLALKFTSHVQNGIIRLDLIRLTSGEILLLEIEDNSPYLALPEKALSQKTKEKAIDALARSLRKRVSGGS